MEKKILDQKKQKKGHFGHQGKKKTFSGTSTFDVLMILHMVHRTILKL
jgi:hypothetical protein